MVSRSQLFAAGLAVLLVVALPMTVYAASGPALLSPPEDPDRPEGSICLPSPALNDISMDAYRQSADDLQTRSSTVESANNGPPDRENTFSIESGFINSDTICFSQAEDTGTVEDDTAIRLDLYGVEFEDTELTGAWTDIYFAEGEAESMTVVVPREVAAELILQVPFSVDLPATLLDLVGLDVAIAGGDETNGTENTTAPDSVENATGWVDETTDSVENSTGGVTEPVDETTGETTDAVDETTGETTDAVDETTDAVDDTVDETTDTVDEENESTGWVDNTTDEVTDTVDDTADAVNDTADEVTDTIDGGSDEPDENETDENETDDNESDGNETDDDNGGLFGWLGW